MTALYLGIILFGGSHLFSILFPGARDSLKLKLGEKAWKGLYALVSLAGLVLLIIGYWQSRGGPLAADWVYVPAEWTRHVTMLFVLLAFILIGASHGKGYLKTWLHNPMSIGIALWATGHLLANGKRTDVYLFGMFLVVALADIVMSELRGKRPAHEPRLRSDIIAVITGMVLYVFFLFVFHPYVLNIPIIQ
jgi:uncharacterized membrane protein